MWIESSKYTAHGPKSRNFSNKINARNRCTGESNTCNTMGNCSGGSLMVGPVYLSHISNAVSCCSKNDECW